MLVSNSYFTTNSSKRLVRTKITMMTSIQGYLNSIVRTHALLPTSRRPQEDCFNQEGGKLSIITAKNKSVTNTFLHLQNTCCVTQDTSCQHVSFSVLKSIHGHLPTTFDPWLLSGKLQSFSFFCEQFISLTNVNANPKAGHTLEDF